LTKGWRSHAFGNRDTSETQPNDHGPSIKMHSDPEAFPARRIGVLETNLDACLDQTEQPATASRWYSWSNQEKIMDWNRVEGNWKEVKGKVKEKWGKLTDDDLTAINGQRDQLEGRLQQRYGYAKDQARKDVDTWFSTLK
jgi:uncharacterized protein YjbJ (UPF0337 family)